MKKIRDKIVLKSIVDLKKYEKNNKNHPEEQISLLVQNIDKIKTLINFIGFSNPMDKVCYICKNIFKIKPSHYDKRVTCSKECYKKHCSNKKGDKSPNWKGGEQYHINGWKWVYCPNHPNAHKNMVAEHRLIMEKHLGRYLTSNEIVHHKDNNKLNNDILNLELTNKSEHMKIHMNDEKRKEKNRQGMYKVLNQRWGYEIGQ